MVLTILRLMSTAEETIIRTFNVLLDRRGMVDAALAALVKRAARKGIAGALAWTWGKPTSQLEDVWVANGAEGEYVKQYVTRIPLVLEGVTPRLAGWRFVATLQHLDGENIVRTLPGETIAEAYRTRGPVCDHCHIKRRRNDTYILRHEASAGPADASAVQVGSSCLRDFLGGDDAAIIAAKAEILALAASVADGEDDERYGRGGPTERLLSEYLPYVAWTVREDGWISRTAAKERDGVTASADRAWTLLLDLKARKEANCAPTAEDIELAAAAELWAESIPDADIDSAKGDYLHNLRAVARTGLASHRTAGIAASAVTAYQRHIGQMRQRAARAERASLSVHLGTVGERVSFGLPPKTGKRGKPTKGAPVVLSLAPVTLDFVTGYDTDYGYVTVLKFRTEEGALLVWKASGDCPERDDVGKTYTLVGRIKKHDEYKGEKQTMMTLCTVEEVKPAEETT